MEAFKHLIPLLLTLSLGGLVLSVGLNSTRGDLLYVLRHPKLMAKAFVAVDVIPPFIAIVLAALLPVEPVVKAGIVLMAISPVPPLVPSQQMSVGARKEYAYGVYVAMALLAIIQVPIALAIAGKVFSRHAEIPLADIAKTILTGVLIPLAIGVAGRMLAPALAPRLSRWVYILSMVLVLIVFLPLIASLWPDIRELLGNGTVLTMAAVVIGSLIGGHYLGGHDIQDRATLAIASSIRHPGIAMMLASANFANKYVTAAAILYLLVAFILVLPYKMWIKRQETATAAEA